MLARTTPDPFERGRALWWPHRVDETALHECAAALVGTHDFTAFTPSQTYHTHFHRHVYRAGWRRNGDILEFHIEADAFMRTHEPHPRRHDARGRGRAPRELRAAARGRPRNEAGRTAPPHGLYLESVRYT